MKALLCLLLHLIVMFLHLWGILLVSRMDAKGSDTLDTFLKTCAIFGVLLFLANVVCLWVHVDYHFNEDKHNVNDERTDPMLR